MTEEYDGKIEVEFEGMPSIRLESYKSMLGSGLIQRLAMATKRRRFSLRDDWTIELNDIDYSDDLNGTVEIPAKDSNKKSIVFDGASIPFPWLVSLLTIGILRPLGVILVGSIVHDYAYRYGVLRISKNSQDYQEVPVPRHQADKLFRDIVGTVIRLPAIGYIAWFAVRIGWLWVKYNGKRFGGKPPVAEYALLLVIAFGAYYLYLSFGLLMLFSALSCLYVTLYVLSFVLAKSK